MNIWVGQVSASGLILTNELVKSKGREFGSLLGISKEELKFLNRWNQASESLFQYELENIYNVDETVLFYCMLPNQTLAKQPVARSKQLKYIDSEFRIQDRKILLFVGNAPSYSLPELSNITKKKQLTIIKLKGRLKSNTEVLAEDYAEVHTEDHAKVHTEDHAEVHIKDHAGVHVEDYIKAHVKGLIEAHMEEQEPIPILLVDETNNLLRH
ncbi:41971_t:CDS:2 [Gigaspora margarita]|uniref:41971_t:CDS:1 n=1 Tax=Gigaspora margarita TaxID=4874 RepID=A0ABN7VQC7_GIGMA|nr:41971_t:CDS:2 [Gigaspora margarita]